MGTLVRASETWYPHCYSLAINGSRFNDRNRNGHEAASSFFLAFSEVAEHHPSNRQVTKMIEALVFS